MVVLGLRAIHSCRSEAGTALAGVRLGTGFAAGRLIVARASLVHQISAATTATTTVITTAATTSARVRRSGLTIRRAEPSWGWPPRTCAGGGDGAGRKAMP